jgi:heme-degrading monooxygenase HmoA
MIARIWTGATRADDRDRYLDYLKVTGLAEYARTPGLQSSLTLRRIVDDRAEFVLITLWDSMESIRGFAGESPDRAVFYPEDDRFLVERDEQVSHFEVVDHRSGST